MRESDVGIRLPHSLQREIFLNFGPMGIQGLTKLISDEAPDAITEKDFASFTGVSV